MSSKTPPPSSFKEGCPECMKICFMLGSYFEGDGVKASLWLATKNPHLGDMSPAEMMDSGRDKKLAKWMFNQLDENWRL